MYWTFKLQKTIKVFNYNFAVLVGSSSLQIWVARIPHDSLNSGQHFMDNFFCQFHDSPLCIWHFAVWHCHLTMNLPPSYSLSGCSSLCAPHILAVFRINFPGMSSLKGMSFWWSVESCEYVGDLRHWHLTLNRPPSYSCSGCSSPWNT